MKDKQGYIFNVPNFCINDPVYIKEYDNVEPPKEEMYNIVMCDILKSKEITVEISNYLSGEELAQVFLKKIKEDPSKFKVRMVYQGHEIVYEHLLYLHKIDPQNPKVLVTYRSLDD